MGATDPERRASDGSGGASPGGSSHARRILRIAHDLSGPVATLALELRVLGGCLGDLEAAIRDGRGEDVRRLLDEVRSSHGILGDAQRRCAAAHAQLSALGWRLRAAEDGARAGSPPGGGSIAARPSRSIAGEESGGTLESAMDLTRGSGAGGS